MTIGAIDEKSAPNVPFRHDLVWIPGGAFRMGSNHHYPEEAPFIAYALTISESSGRL
jgi:hypothetical protein